MHLAHDSRGIASPEILIYLTSHFYVAERRLYELDGEIEEEKYCECLYYAS